MTSWQIIKTVFLAGKRPESVGGILQLQQAVKVFIQLHDAELLRDAVAALEEYNADEDVTKALTSVGWVAELERAGVL